MKNIKRIDGVCKYDDNLAPQLDELRAFVVKAAKEGASAHEVEERIWQSMLSFGHETLKLFFNLCGDGDVGEDVKLPDGRLVQRLKEPHGREYQSIFGLFELNRVVYGEREGRKIEYVPIDTRLQLPASKFSYVLQDWDQSLAVDDPYAKVDETLRKILGFSQCIDSIERMNRKMAESVEAFWEDRPVPQAFEEGELMVCSADGKGVPICCKAKEPAIDDHRPKKGPKPNRKKMALLGATYTLNRFSRTPEEIIESLFRTGSSRYTRKKPKPQHKRVRASLARCDSGTSQPAFKKIFGWMKCENDTRNNHNEKPLVILMDGQESLWKAAAEYLPQENIVLVLDLLHVTPRLWKAANIFYPDDYEPALSFVKELVLKILQGKTSSVVCELRELSISHDIKGKKKEELEKICTYFENNQHRMHYDEYLAAGYPIATGVIEGACRHLVKDRLERAGMRWVLKGAQAMLNLRSVYISGLWNEFIEFRIKKETENLYPYSKLNEAVKLPLPAW
jgi:hypothetical protein